MTERRQKEKEIQKLEHPSIGNVKVQLGTNRTGKIVVKEGDDPEFLAENFMALYSLPRIHKQTIINKINQVFTRKTLIETQKKSQNSYSLEEDSSRNQNSGTEEPNVIQGETFFNIPKEKVNYSGTIGKPVRLVRPMEGEVENENPNQNMMSPHFRGPSVEKYEQKQENYQNISKPNKYCQPQNPKLQLENPGEFIGFSPESSESFVRRGSVTHNSHGKLLNSSKNSKRSNSKQSKSIFNLNYRKIKESNI